ncbi:DNA-binding transcription factor [Lithospermum erythrorhizon]|uniref:DNA-binding transcription factor n=1 Tax=Lithospermum erythrorhizon TaxID=34254 RepID=A0AAV3NQY7_LITER
MMGKTRKVSKGNSTHFVPDYRHAVETMTELERGRRLRRVDAEMIASEGSCAPKRRCVSLNGDNYDNFGVPVDVFPVSQMSHSERRDLEWGLKNELQHVRVLQQRLASMGSNALPSPARDIRSLSGGIKRSALDKLNRTMNEVAMLKGKQEAVHGRYEPYTKGTGGRLPEPAKPALPSSTTIFMLMKQCETLLQRLMSHDVAYVFKEPVDTVKLNIPDYLTIIKQPMDLGTIKGKLFSGQYSDPLGFAADVRLTFSNAMTYNPQGNAVHTMAKTLSKFFMVRWKQIEKKLSVMVDFPVPLKPSSNIESETATSKPPMKKKKVANLEHEVKQNSVERVMTLDEKHNLSADLVEVAAELPDNIIDFLKWNTNNSSESNEGEMEIDLGSLTDETLFTLRDLLNDYKSDKLKSEGKVELCEIELHHEQMFSNSSVQACGRNDLADEDVDIGGNNALISSFPPLEIEKDGAGKINKYSSSSSSSDSDAGSASHGDSDGIKNQAQVNVEKETCSSGESLERKGSYIGATATGFGGCDKLDFERNFGSGSSVGSLEGRGNAPSERQDSPEKNCRSTLLRSPFADTILEVQENALGKDENMDLDRLKLETGSAFISIYPRDGRAEAFEAGAAEVAQREFEAEAAAETKKYYICSRTEFNRGDNSDGDQNDLVSNKLQASSYPLELLGLYTKDEDDD